MRALLLSFFLISLAQVHGQGEFRLSAWNDSWGGGLAPVYDDLRTFHFELDYEKKNRFRIQSRYSLLTNRFDPDSLHRRSLDELVLSGSWALLRFNNGTGGNLWLKGGMVATGDIIGSQIQNTAHEVFGVTLTNLPYYDGNNVYPTLGYSLEKRLISHPLGSGRELQWWLHQSLDHHHGYVTNLGIAGPLTLKTASTSFALTAAYAYLTSHLPDNRLVERVLKAESGVWLGMEVTGRILFLNFRYFPSGNFSYGGVGFRFYRGMFSTAEERDLGLQVELSLLNKGYGYNLKYAFLPFLLLNRKANIIINHNFHTYLRTYLPQSPTVNGHANQLTAGMELRLLKNRETERWVEPYVNLSAGNRVVSVYSRELPVATSTSHHFTLNGDLGLYLNLPLFSRLKPLSLSFYYRTAVQHSLTPARESPLVNANNSPYAPQRYNLGGGVRFSL